MADAAAPGRPSVYSIAAHRGFADALVAGLVPRYAEPGFGLARLTLLVPSTRARRTLAEAFIRHAGETGAGGLLMPRMAVVGDLDLDETLGAALDPMGLAPIPPAVDPRRRTFELARILAREMGDAAPKGATLLRLARETGDTMDRLLIEDIGPEQLVDEGVTGVFPDLSEHWQASLRLFAVVQARWLDWLAAHGRLDAAARRNRLFEAAAARWREAPPATPVVAAGVTSAAPMLARMLRVVSELPRGAVVLPDLDLAMDEAVWEELGRAGAAPAPGEAAFARGDAVTHPQYHLKLLLNRMGVAQAEVRAWHRRGIAAAPPERSHAISALFLPPEASKVWATLDPDKRRLAGVRIMETANPEDEAQAIAVLVRRAVETAGRRVAVITPDRALARRIVHHLGRWNIVADDSGGRPLSQTAAGRAFLMAAEVMAEHARLVPLIGLLSHPFAAAGMERRVWLGEVRLLEKALRGPRPRPGLEPLAAVARKLGKDSETMRAFWAAAEPILAALTAPDPAGDMPLDALLDILAAQGEALMGERLWAREDGRMLAGFIETFREEARAAGHAVPVRDIAAVLRDAMECCAVRPPYGGHGRVQILGLLEARFNRADLVVCGGLNEGTWPARGGVDALLAPPVLRTLGVPGADYRIGLSAHDLAAALGAPEVVLSRARRDEAGPSIPSRFLLRVEALLGELRNQGAAREDEAPALAARLDDAQPAPAYPRPRPDPAPELRRVPISATALDRLLGDPYQFYAASILHLRDLPALDAEPDAAWQGTLVHSVLQRWHEAHRAGRPTDLVPLLDDALAEANADPVICGLWRPRLARALEWVEAEVAAYTDRRVVAIEAEGAMTFDGVRVHGRADRIDRLPGGDIAIIDYKTGSAPSAAAVEAGYALQLGVLGLIAAAGGFADAPGPPAAYEYWSLKRNDRNPPYGFGSIEVPLKVGAKRSGLEPDALLPATKAHLTRAVSQYIRGRAPFTARVNPDYPAFDTYDQLMRLDEWLPRLDQAVAP